MKKTYILLLLTAHIVSTTCMQQQFKQQLFSYFPQENDSDATSFLLQPATTDLIELAPIYRSTINTVSLAQPDVMGLMQQLYNDTYEFLSKENSLKGTNQFTQEKKLAVLINSINQARSNRITEDVMGKFAYDNQRHLGGIVSVSTALFFNILKTYNAIVRKTQEPLPFNKNQLNKNQDDVYSSFQKHIAFFNLHHILKILLQEYTTETKHNLAACLYADANVLFQCSQDSYTDLKSEFYNRAHSVLINNGNKHELYELLPIIASAKAVFTMHQENNFESGITHFEPTETIKDKLYNFFNAKHSTNNTENRIILLCKLMETYSNAQGNKAIPTLKQFYAYQLQKNLNLALPDLFNSTVFDENIYALTEFGQLLDSITDLINPDDHNVQKCEKTWCDSLKVDYV